MRIYSQVQSYLTDKKTEFLVNFTTVLLGLFVFFAPFRGYLTAFWEISFYLSLAICVILASLRKIRLSFKTPLTIPLACFFIWALIGVFFALYPENSIHDVIFHILKYIISFFLLFNFFNTPRKFVNLSWVLIISGTVFTLWVIIYFYLFLDHSYTERIDILNFSINTIGFISLSVLTLSLFMYDEAPKRSEKIFLIFSVLMTTIITIQSIASFLGLAFSLIMLVFIRRKTIIVYAASLIMLFLMINSNLVPLHNRFQINEITNKFNSDERQYIWYFYSNVIKDYPITGIGYSLEMWQYPDFWERYLNKLPKELVSDGLKTTKFDPHNMFISIAVHTGIVGFLIFMSILAAFANTSIKLIRKGRTSFAKNWAVCISALFIGYLIKGMAEEGLSNVGIFIFYVVLAMMGILNAINENKKQHSELDNFDPSIKHLIKDTP